MWERRRLKIVSAEKVSEVLQNHSITLVFLEACHSARADDLTASVAGALLRGGVASVVAMTHAVLVETARRFVGAFYDALAGGSTIGEAVLAGQQVLKRDPFRLEIFGAGQLQLRDWFVPVLYQSVDDHYVFSSCLSETRVPRSPKNLEPKLGLLPVAPSHRFVGRSRELLALERMLAVEHYGVILGLGGEGKTILAAELALWLVRTKRFERTAFVSLENVFDIRTFVDQVGRQVVPGYSAADYSQEELLDQAFEPINEMLCQRSTLVIIDNVESVLPDENKRPQSFSAYSLQEMLALCQRMSQAGNTRLLFTSRERLPAPFDAVKQVLLLGSLARYDAISLFQRVLIELGKILAPHAALDAPSKSESLVDALCCHAQSIVSLAPYVAEFGIQRAAHDPQKLMEKLHERHPREHPLFASVELSLNRLPTSLREQIRPLGLFHGGAKKAAIAALLGLNESEKQSMAEMLIRRGLAQQIPGTSYLRFHPALSFLLLSELKGEPLKRAQERWIKIMQSLVSYLYQIKTNNTSTASALTILELSNLTRLLECLKDADDYAAAAQTALEVEHLLLFLGRLDVLDQARAVREALVNKLGGWGSLQFEAEKLRIETLLNNGSFSEALEASDSLLVKSLMVGESAYPEAPRHLAGAFLLKGQILNRMDAADAALNPLQEAKRRFLALAEANPSEDPEAFITISIDIAVCLIGLGRFDEAATELREEIESSERFGHVQTLAIARHWLGTAYLKMFLYNDALREFIKAREFFESVGEPIAVGQAWHMIGATLWYMDRLDEAEIAYKCALSINVQQKNKVEEAKNLVQLAHLYGEMEKYSEAIDLYQEAILRTKETGNLAGEGRSHGGLASILIARGRHDEARREILASIECHRGLGYAVEPWHGWGSLEWLEQAIGNRHAAATAHQKATALFLAYRRQGGSFRTLGGQIGDYFVRDYLAERFSNIRNEIGLLAERGQDDSFAALVSTLAEILDGATGVLLADNPRLNYYDAAEVLLVLERLNK
jgi:tetratricopeptide (TPR) repeat protein